MGLLKFKDGCQSKVEWVYLAPEVLHAGSKEDF